MERRGASDEAFDYFDRAVEIAPENVLVRYRRAKLLVGMKKYDVRLVLLGSYRDWLGKADSIRLTSGCDYRPEDSQGPGPRGSKCGVSTGASIPFKGTDAGSTTNIVGGTRHCSKRHEQTQAPHGAHPG